MAGDGDSVVLNQARARDRKEKPRALELEERWPLLDITQDGGVSSSCLGRGMGTALTGDCAGGAVAQMGSFRKKSLGGRVLFAKDGGTAEPDDG